MQASDPEFRRVLEDIKLRAPIEEIVGERVPLVQKGRVFWACCPFHDEKTGSFKVDPERGTWYCFGACRKGGDVISFLQESDGVTFMDALEILASRVGVTLPRRRPRRTVEGDKGLAALAFADQWYQRQLSGPAGREARGYLERRGITRSAIEAFGLGFAPTGRAFLDAAHAEGIRFEDLESTGLARRGEDGSVYSFFRGRLMIPIRDLSSQTVAFGARRLSEGEHAGPKYVNTPETTYFHKGRLVYALDRAIESVRRAGHLVLVEGYTDVIAAHQAGVPFVAAVLGTATTSDHAAWPGGPALGASVWSSTGTRPGDKLPIGVSKDSWASRPSSRWWSCPKARIPRMCSRGVPERLGTPKRQGKLTEPRPSVPSWMRACLGSTSLRTACVP